MIWSEEKIGRQPAAGVGGAARIDPYWLWAKATQFANFPRVEGGWMQVVIELKKDRTAIQLIEKLNDLYPGQGPDRGPCRIPGAYLIQEGPLAQACYCTALVRSEFFETLGTAPELKALVNRVEMNVRIGPVDALPVAGGTFKPQPRPQSRQPVLLGVVDDGCAFARYASSGPCRILAIWDQEPDSRLAIHAPEDGRVVACSSIAVARSRALSIPSLELFSLRTAPVALSPAAVPTEAEPPLFLQGTEVVRGQIEAVFDRCRDKDGSLDEDACYLVTKYDRLRSRVTHGAHVLDLLAGTQALRARAIVRAGGTGMPPPAGEQAGCVSKAAQADIVFVQMPRAELRDPSGMWLGASVLDGLRYILGWANKDTECIVANVSYAPQHGPHDGTSILECAMDELARLEPKLNIALPAGNGFEARGHAIVRMMPGRQESLRWQALPDNDTPSFLELWLPEHAARFLKISVAPPGAPQAASGPVGVGRAAFWPTSNRPRCGLIFPSKVSRGLRGTMVLVALSPTVALRPGDAAAPYGTWTIGIRDTRTNPKARAVEVHAYVVRNDVNLGFRRRGRQSFLSADGQEGEGAWVTPWGTLSGIATGSSSGRVRVAAGYRAVDGMPADYSAAGPTRGVRRAPDGAAVTEQSATLHGVPAAGTRSGSVVRLRGTSMAAPQMARYLVDDCSIGRVPASEPKEDEPGPTPKQHPPPPDPQHLRERLGDHRF